MDARICPSCGEKNNPQFASCWKCHINFTTGGKESPIKPAATSISGPLPSKNITKDLFSFRNPYDLEHAGKMLMNIAGVFYALGLLSFVFLYFGKNLGEAVNGVTYFALGFAIGERKSRTCAILSSLNTLATAIAGMAVWTPETRGGAYNIPLSLFMFILSLKAVQCSYFWHKLAHSKINVKNTALKIVLAAGYVIGFFVIFNLLYWLLSHFEPINSAGERAVKAVFLAPAIAIVASALSGFLPYTREKPMATFS